MPALTDLSTIRSLCDRYGFSLSKGFGQNFIINPGVCPRIAESAGIGPDWGVLEIGPGIGPLTVQLCARAGKVAAVELDRSLLPVLAETMAEFDNFTLIPGDILKLDIPALVDEVVAHRADIFAFARYCPTSEEKDVAIEPLRYRQLLADCDRKFKEYEAAGCETYFNKKDHLWTLYEYETGAFKIPENVQEGMIYGGCNCGNCHLTILPNGDIYACRRVQNSKVGNVFTDRIADVWVCQMEQYRDYAKFEKCAKCRLLAFCRGCPAVASGKDGNFYAADPQCWMEVAG